MTDEIALAAAESAAASASSAATSAAHSSGLLSATEAARDEAVAAASGGGSVDYTLSGLCGYRRMIPGRYYGPPSGYVTGAASQTLNAPVASPLVVPATVTLDRIGVEVTTAGAAGATIRLGIYASTATDLPGALVLDAGTVDATTTGVKEITISQTLQPGVYWLALVQQGATSTTRTVAFASALVPQSGISTTIGEPASALGGNPMSGALSSPWFATPSASIRAPKVMVRAA